MLRRIPGRALVLGSLCLALGLAGCEPRHSWSRKGDDMMSRYADGDDDSRPSKVIGGSAEDASPRSFFKNNRSSGGWSSEAREIESHLGAS